MVLIFAYLVRFTISDSLNIDQIAALTPAPSSALELPRPQDYDAANHTEKKNNQNMDEVVVRHEMGVSPIRSGLLLGVGEGEGDACKATTMTKVSANELTDILLRTFREHGIIVNVKDGTLERAENQPPDSDVFGTVTVNSTPEIHMGTCFLILL